MKTRVRQYKNWRGDDEFEPQWKLLWWHPYRCSYDCPINFKSLKEAEEFADKAEESPSDADIIHDRFN